MKIECSVQYSICYGLLVILAIWVSSISLLLVMCSYLYSIKYLLQTVSCFFQDIDRLLLAVGHLALFLRDIT